MESLISLQIFRPDLVVASQTRSNSSVVSNNEEALSVYELFKGLTSTLCGQKELKKMFLQPTMDTSKISDRQQAIALLLRPRHADKIKQISYLLKHIPNSRLLVSQLKRGLGSTHTNRKSRHSVWAGMDRFVSTVLQLKTVLVTLLGNEKSRLLFSVINLFHIQIQY